MQQGFMGTCWCTACSLRLRRSWLLCPYAILLLYSTVLFSSPTSFQTVGAAAATVPSPSSTSPRGNETDRLFLLDFKDGVTGGGGGGPVGGALSSWNHSLHHCQWGGVACSRRHPGRVTELVLASATLTGSIPSSIANLTFLQWLDLSDNQLRGTIPPQLGAFRRLRYLNLSRNVLSSTVPSNLSNCMQLQLLDLDRNQLSGEIPASLSRLSNLFYLSIRSNQLTGAIPPSLGNLSSDAFRVLWLSENKLTGNIPSELGRLTNLQFLGLLMNGLSGTVPHSVYNLSNLNTISLYQNQLSGTLPPDLATTLPNLEVLNVGENMFQGEIPTSLSNASYLQEINFGNNSFKGTIPNNLGDLKYLTTFAAPYNQLEAREHRNWDFLTSLTNCTQLRFLSLASNHLRGELPTSIANLSADLQHLFLCGNQISGTIPTGIGNFRGLMRLCMRNNRFHGGIPPAIGKLRNLEGLSLINNQLSGEIPLELGNLTRLSYLQLDNNNLSGGIPKSFKRYQQIRYLQIAGNSVSGEIPGELMTTLLTLAVVDLSRNFLEGPLPSNIGNLINLRSLDLSGNRFSGDVPPSLGSCQSMVELYLRGNSLEGSIPPSLGGMKSIQRLDLSLNKFTGRIPKYLEDFEFLTYLNLSFNDFMGEVPKRGVFANATAVSLLGNKMVCGGTPVLRLPRCKSQVGKKRHSSKSLVIILSSVMGGILCLLLFVCFIIYLRWMRRSKRKGSNIPSTFETGHKFVSYHDLVKATDEFSQKNLIGRGSFGSVYKGVLEEEEIVAVKVLNTQRRGASKSFKSECEALRNIRHRNLVKIISVCSSIDFSGNDFRALVFEYFPNGSLEKWLHLGLEEVESRTLDFAQRLSIAVDVACALDYLHNHCHSPIVHCDLKPSNILLDCNMTAHVGDFGLARFVLRTSTENAENQSSTIGIKGSIGYVAPEYGLGNPVSTYGDVYSFGIMLLELFTGIRPVDDILKDGLSFQRFVEAALPKQAMSIIDPCLILQNSAVESSQDAPNNGDLSKARMCECFVSLMQIGLNCTKEAPRERLAMAGVMKEIQLIQRAYLI
ncbi:hypothetical protein Taro_033157 [Colocasia esculenta]|uniref:Receptor kinase-like protein Xa21 n=1 Tax=Colocasia esculenta TaxID=4460 RepID=A0A843VX16_COLES|nr:hypothetical protein [Colocasia esculenta]